MDIPILVAHRGDVQNYPENTLEGIEAAVRVGACVVEFDVQLTRDGVPIIYHDDTLRRTSGVPERLFDLKYEQLQQYSAGEVDRLGDKFRGIKIPTLSQLVSLLQSWPRVMIMVEIKEESLEEFGCKNVVDRITEILAPIKEQCIIISYDADSLDYSRAFGDYLIGWVLHRWDDRSKEHAQELKLDYLICNYKKISLGENVLWQGPWQWVLYEVVDPDLALELAACGATYVETMEIKEMLLHPVLSRAKCFDG